MPLAAVDPRLTDAHRAAQSKAYADRAVELVREAVNKGYHDVAALKGDHNFDALGSRADFRELLVGSAASAAKRSP